jgi:hypothetical protein
MKRFALCLMFAASLPAFAGKKVPSGVDATCEKACSGTNKGCAAACLHSSPCVKGCTSSYKACAAGCKK